MLKQTGSIQQFSLLFLTLFAISKSAHIGSLYDNYPSPKWWNSCRWPTFDRIFIGSLLLPKEELFNNVIKSARVAKNHAERIKTSYDQNTFEDPIFGNEVKNHNKQRWLPIIPHISDTVLQEITTEEAIKMSYEYMQYFAVGIEQILEDQKKYGGSMITQYREIEYELYQLLCNLQYSIHLLNIPQRPNVSRNVMSQEYRNIEESSRRNFRDYNILREYIIATNFIARLFAYHKSRIADQSLVEQLFEQ